MVSDMPAVRLQRLRGLIADGGALSVRTAMSVLDVSEMTVRRDFAALEDLGVVLRTRGGVVPAGRVAGDVAYTQRERQETVAKRDIGALAVGLVDDDDVLFLSGGTTCLAFARALRGQRRVTVITNSVQVLITLSTDPAVSLLASGGAVSALDQDMTGPVAVDVLKRFRVHKAFIGASGISADGVFNSNLSRASTDEIMVDASRNAYVLADHTKLDAVALALVAPLDRISALVTNTAPAEASQQWLDAAALETITVGRPGGKSAAKAGN